MDGLVEPDKSDTLSMYARERFGLHAYWRWCRFTRGMPNDKELPEGTIRLTGAAYYAKKSGKGKGSPNYKKPLEGTERTVFFTVQEHSAWEDARDKQGICKDCAGTGQKWRGWNHETGNRYETCRRCEGTGVPKQAVA